MSRTVSPEFELYCRPRSQRFLAEPALFSAWTTHAFVIEPRTRTRILWLFVSETSYRAVYPGLKHLGKGVFLRVGNPTDGQPVRR